MSTNPLSSWARANAAFRNNEFEGAVALYNEAMNQAAEPLKTRIGFNLRLAELRSKTAPRREGLPSRIENTPPPRAQAVTDDGVRDVMRDIKSHFDPEFYSTRYPDIGQAGIDPLKHYCTKGWIDRRDPRSDFSTATYLELNPDVADAGINPFWHFVVAGEAEGRATQHPGGIKAEMLKKNLTLEQMVQQWKKPEKPPESMTAALVAKLLFQRISAGINSLAISVGHDHYKKISGGIQLCIQREEQLANERGVLYLNVHPWQPLPTLASGKDGDDPLMNLVLAGQDIGVCQSSVLTQTIKQFGVEFHGAIHIIVHSLMGHSTKHVKDWVVLRNDHRCWVWLHDFFTLCPSYALQRNNISFCVAPTIESNSCAICLYGEERRSHTRRMNDFFVDVRATVISPSEVTKQFWLSKANSLITEVKVLPHMDMPWVARAKPVEKMSEKPISVAFLGGAVFHKGWHVFEQLTKILAGDPRFKFAHFGNRKSLISGVQHINVHVTADDYFAMSRAVSEAEIDFVLHWATWPETFSFTTHEAIAGGAYVLTNPISGNVAAAVANTGMGVVLPDEQALFTFFKEGAAEQTAKIIRSNNAARICKPCFSEMTIPFLINEGTV